MQNIKKYRAFLFLLSGVCTLLHTKTNDIILGQTAALSGNLGLYGRTIKNGINAYFEYINNSGGINGKKIYLESLDDKGDPEQAINNIKILQKKGIDIFIGCTGVRSIERMLPLIQEKKIAMLFPWAGDEKFRNPQLIFMINGLGYLKPQLEAIVTELTQKRKINRIAIFHADDDFSTQATQDLMVLLKKEKITPLVTTSYNRLTVDITQAAQKIIETNPKIVISLGTSMPTVDLINYLWSHGYYGINFIGIDSTLFVNSILKSRNTPFTFTSAVPDPTSSQIPLAQEYRKQLDRFAPEESYNILSFSYFLSAAIIVKAIKECSDHISKENVITAIEQFKNTSCDGISLSFDPSTRHIFGTEISIIKG